jgi:hypothetical protein
MTGRHIKDDLPKSSNKAQRGDKSSQKAAKSGRKAISPAKSKIKDNLMNYTKQLASLGNLQQAIVINLQKEIENIEL